MQIVFLKCWICRRFAIIAGFDHVSTAIFKQITVILLKQLQAKAILDKSLFLLFLIAARRLYCNMIEMPDLYLD